MALRDLRGENETQVWVVPPYGGSWSRRNLLVTVALLDAAGTVLDWRRDAPDADGTEIADFARSIVVEGGTAMVSLFSREAAATFVMTHEPAPADA